MPVGFGGKQPVFPADLSAGAPPPAPASPEADRSGSNRQSGIWHSAWAVAGAVRLLFWMQLFAGRIAAGGVQHRKPGLCHMEQQLLLSGFFPVSGL